MLQIRIHGDAEGAHVSEVQFVKRRRTEKMREFGIDAVILALCQTCALFGEL